MRYKNAILSNSLFFLFVLLQLCSELCPSEVSYHATAVANDNHPLIGHRDVRVFDADRVFVESHIGIGGSTVQPNENVLSC